MWVIYNNISDDLYCGLYNDIRDDLFCQHENVYGLDENNNCDILSDNNYVECCKDGGLCLWLTGGIGADVDDFALGPVDLVFVWGGELGLDHDGVLCPGLQSQDQGTWKKQ